MINTFLWIALGLGLVNWISVERKWTIAEIATKPLVMVLLLGWLWQNGLTGQEMVWFNLGIIFSLAGDVLLLAPKEKFFLPGLIAFLIAHIAYIIGFNTSFPGVNPWVIFILLCLVAAAVMVYRGLNQGLISRNAEALRLPVAIYSFVITIMTMSAILNLVRPGVEWQHAILTAAGAILFMFSDSLLAWSKFVKPVPHSGLMIITTYHLGQIGILIGVALHWN